MPPVFHCGQYTWLGGPMLTAVRLCSLSFSSQAKSASWGYPENEMHKAKTAYATLNLQEESLNKRTTDREFKLCRIEVTCWKDWLFRITAIYHIYISINGYRYIPMRLWMFHRCQHASDAFGTLDSFFSSRRNHSMEFLSFHETIQLLKATSATELFLKVRQLLRLQQQEGCQNGVSHRGTPGLKDRRLAKRPACFGWVQWRWASMVKKRTRGVRLIREFEDCKGTKKGLWFKCRHCVEEHERGRWVCLMKEAGVACIAARGVQMEGTERRKHPLVAWCYQLLLMPATNYASLTWENHTTPRSEDWCRCFSRCEAAP